MRRWKGPDEGVLVVVSGPSGVGKSTLVRGAMAELPSLAFSVSATTRAPRPGETDGEDYYFLGEDAFGQRLRGGEFLEHAEVYGRRYGTLESPTRRALAEGRSLILDIDVQGARQVRASGLESVHVLIVPPDPGVLEARLRARATDSPESVRRRMAQVAEQLEAIEEYDYVVVNDDLEVAQRVFTGILLAEMSRVRRHPGIVAAVTSWLAERGMHA